jgi:hypothetical protein
MRSVLLIGSAALALAACQKTTGASNAAASAASATPSASPAGSASGAFRIQPGLWQEAVTRDGRRLAIGGFKTCIDETEATQASVFKPSGQTNAAATDCTRPAPTRGPDGAFSFSTTCSLQGGGQRVTKGVASGDWSTGYHVDLQSDTTGAALANMNGHHTMTMDGKWLGPCPAGMAGGDVVWANGAKFSGGRFTGRAVGGGSGGQ